MHETGGSAMKKRADRHPWLALAAAALVLAMSSAHAEDPQIVYYDVAGNSATALRQQMTAKGPLDDGKRFDAHTDWYVKWNYRYRPTASGCEFTSMDVSLSGTILLPRWNHADDASNALVQKWDTYLAALRLHENGHYAQGANAAKAIEAFARSSHGSGDCAAMVSEFNDQARAIVDKYKAQDAAYDRATDHGRTQGAQFP
jgi:predicted secreted Zn-dependent protease